MEPELKKIADSITMEEVLEDWNKVKEEKIGLEISEFLPETMQEIVNAVFDRFFKVVSNV